MKKTVFIILTLLIVISTAFCIDCNSQVKDLQTTISEKDKTIRSLKINYENKLKAANRTIAQQESTIDNLEDQLSEAESYTEVSNNNVNESEYVYVTRTGSKYHRIWCSYLSNSCFSMTLDDALSAGYDACSRCH